MKSMVDCQDNLNCWQRRRRRYSIVLTGPNNKRQTRRSHLLVLVSRRPSTNNNNNQTTILKNRVAVHLPFISSSSFIMNDGWIDGLMNGLHSFVLC
ncbi:hypothetical protein SAMD00019534_111690, partial [Acytostelium subglobosum LB1]|uniref:hypothetical protein n=1 Tax=Acytostelium subglobosum LB1 TaxID=1410327 RepID=UPI000644AD86